MLFLCPLNSSPFCWGPSPPEGDNTPGQEHSSCGCLLSRWWSKSRGYKLLGDDVSHELLSGSLKTYPMLLVTNENQEHSVFVYVLYTCTVHTQQAQRKTPLMSPICEVNCISGVILY